MKVKFLSPLFILLNNWFQENVMFIRAGYSYSSALEVLDFRLINRKISMCLQLLPSLKRIHFNLTKFNFPDLNVKKMINKVIQ